MRWLLGLLAALIVATLGAGIGVVAVGRSVSAKTAGIGDLADLLARHDAARVASLVAPAERAELSATRLQDAWDYVVTAIGEFQRVVRTVTVTEGPVVHELEVLSFSRGSATLSALRRASGITGLLLLAGPPTDQQAAAVGADFAEDLVRGQFDKIDAAFDQHMAAGLPYAQLASITSTATAHLRAPAKVAAQLTVPRGPFTIVETYLVFTNGLRSVEVTLNAEGKIAGLYLRAI